MKIETKYDIGQKVWVNDFYPRRAGKKIVQQEVEIFYIEIFRGGVMYCTYNGNFPENNVYLTEQEAKAHEKKYEMEIIEIQKSIINGQI